MDPTEAMQRAIELASATPDPRPNPRVGCVILSPQGEVVGEGAHQRAGGPHAEILALEDAGERARGATAVVTMEPCNHVGRTGPCSEALLDAGVAAVAYGQADPNPAARGGANTLRVAGLMVTDGLLVDRALALNHAWNFAQEHGRPWVIWKVAATLDGKVAAVDGSSRWITGEAARRQVHELRAQVGAVLVGSGTVLADDPDLSSRDVPGAIQPMRVVMGQRSVPAAARVRAAPPVENFRQIPSRDPEYALAQLHRSEIASVLLEGGPSLAGAFLKAGLIDEIRWYTAPAVLGTGVSGVPDLGIFDISRIRRFRVAHTELVGEDVRIDMRIDTPDAGTAE